MSGLLQAIRRDKKRRPARSRPPRWRWLALFVAALIAVWGVYQLGRATVLSQMLRVAQIDVRGVERLGAEEIRALVVEVENQPILLVDLDRIRDSVQKVPGVERAVAARRMPDIIEVFVTERTAIALAELARKPLLIDAQGMLFPMKRELAGDADLPRMRGLATPPGAVRLTSEDIAGLRAIKAFERVLGTSPPPGTIVDLTPTDRIVFRPGPDAPALWLDRDHPERNLENLFAFKDQALRLASGRPIDLRFPRRLFLALDENGRR